MSYNMPANVGQYLSQSQAAAFAVLCSNVRDEMESDRKVAATTEEREVAAFFQELEAIATASIARNDGNVVKWIGIAAKQMNPLLS